MTDWTNPTTAQTHTNELAATRGRDESNAKMDYTGDSNIPDGTIRWNKSTVRFEIWDATGAVWSALATKYLIDVDKLDGLDAGNGAGQVPISNGTVNTNLNADLLDSQQGSYYLDRANHSNTQVPSTISPQGDGSGLDADTVDGLHASAFEASGAVAIHEGAGDPHPQYAGQTEFDTHAALTNPHGSTSAPTPNTLVLRDGAGRSQVVDPAVAADIATKGYVDGAVATQLQSGDLVTPEELGGGVIGDISQASYTGDSFLTVAQTTNPERVAFKSDGTKMYLMDSTDPNISNIFQYTLTEPWCLDTAVYDGVIGTTQAHSSRNRGMYLRSDGLKIYFQTNNHEVYQYSLGVAWDISTLTYDGINFNTGAEPGSHWTITFKPDGTRMYVSGQSGTSIRRINQYHLASAWDVSSTSFLGEFLDIIAQQDSPRGIAFSLDGSRLYVLGQQPDAVHQYELTSPWDVTSASYSGNSFSTTAEPGSKHGLVFSTDGSLMFTIGTAADNERVFKYSVPGRDAVLTLAGTQQIVDDTLTTEFPGTPADTGSQQIFGGFLMQWASSGPLSNGQDAVVPFEKPFPTATLKVFVSVRDDTLGGASANARVQSFTASDATVHLEAGGGTAFVDVLAIGH